MGRKDKRVFLVLVIMVAVLLLVGVVAVVFIASMDEDGDGLSDWKEMSLGTDLKYANSDSDELSDYDEVKIYSTNPLTCDTDEDGANDDVEIKNNMDPLCKDTDDDGILDGEERVIQEVGLLWGKEEALAQTGTMPVLKLTGKAAGGTQISITDISYNRMYDMDFRVGAPYEILFEENSFEEAEISFQLSETILTGRDIETLAIYFVAEDDRYFDILQVIHDAENQKITASMAEEGVYFVVDMESWYEYYDGITF